MAYSGSRCKEILFQCATLLQIHKCLRHAYLDICSGCINRLQIQTQLHEPAQLHAPTPSIVVLLLHQFKSMLSYMDQLSYMFQPLQQWSPPQSGVSMNSDPCLVTWTSTVTWSNLFNRDLADLAISSHLQPFVTGVFSFLCHQMYAQSP